MPDDFPNQLAELLGYLDGTLPADHPFASLTNWLPEQRPGVWLLGSSPQSRIWATEGGLRYAFADFINPDGRGVRAARRRGRGLGRVRGDRGGGAAAGGLEPDDVQPAAARAADPGAAAGEGAALPGGVRRYVAPIAARAAA